MKKYKPFFATACTALVLLLAACGDNNTPAGQNEQDTNLLDSRRFTDTTGNYITGDSSGINQTPATEGVGLDQ